MKNVYFYYFQFLLTFIFREVKIYIIVQDNLEGNDNGLLSFTDSQIFKILIGWYKTFQPIDLKHCNSYIVDSLQWRKQDSPPPPLHRFYRFKLLVEKFGRNYFRTQKS